MGQIDGLKRGNAVQKKIDYEDKYTETAATSEEWNAEYGEIVKTLRDLSTTFNESDFTYNMYIEYVYVGAEMFHRARAIDELMELYQEEKYVELEAAIEEQKAGLNTFYSQYDIRSEEHTSELQSRPHLV